MHTYMQRRIKRQANNARSSSIDDFDHNLIDHDRWYSYPIFFESFDFNCTTHIYPDVTWCWRFELTIMEQICVQKVVCRFSHINPWVSHIWYIYTCIYFRGKSVALSKSTYHLSQACTIDPWWFNSICLNFTIQFSKVLSMSDIFIKT